MTRRTVWDKNGVAHRICTDGPDGRWCASCLTASREATKRMRAARALQLEANPDAAPHGRVNTYQHWSCRCDRCRDAARIARSRYKNGGRPGRPSKATPFGREWLDGA